MKRKREIIGTLAGLALVGSLIGIMIAWPVSTKAPGNPNLIRLHIIANSDSAADQALKLAVRDAVISTLGPALAELTDTAQARDYVANNLDQFTAVAAQVICHYGAAYKVQAKLGRSQFPTRVYGDLVLPAGEYEALRLTIGSGQGQNWWCVLFPPLCFVDAAGAIAVDPEQAAKLTAAPADTPVLVAEADPGEITVELRSKAAEVWRRSIARLERLRDRLAKAEAK